MTHIPDADEAVFLRPAVTMALRFSASSENAEQAVDAIAIKLMKSGAKAPLANHKRVLAAMLADLLQAASHRPAWPCFRPMKATSFEDSPYKRHAVSAVLGGLIAGGFVVKEKGYCSPVSMTGKATRIIPAPSLVDELAAYGIRPSNWQAHFCDECPLPLVADPIRLKDSSDRGWVYKTPRTGESVEDEDSVSAAGNAGGYAWGKIPGCPMTVDYTDPRVIELADQVQRINAFLAKQSFEFPEGQTFKGLFRGFNEGDQIPYGWNKGGRLYAVGGSYQLLEKKVRPVIRINGEPVVEVDIRASHPTILHALTKTPLPEGDDIYAVPGVDRAAIKRFVTMAIGNGRVPRSWTPSAKADYLSRYKKAKKRTLTSGVPFEPKGTGDLNIDSPFKAVKEAALNRIPLLNSLDSLGFTWADIQFFESQALVEALISLMNQGIPTLPLHDSLICRASDSDSVSKALSDSFFNQFKLYPSLKIEGFSL